MQVLEKQDRKHRLPGVSQNGCIRHGITWLDHVWLYDFLTDRTEDGHLLKLLAMISKFTRECLAILVVRSRPRM